MGGYPKISPQLIQDAFFLPSHIIQADLTFVSEVVAGVNKHCLEPTPTWMVILLSQVVMVSVEMFAMFNGNLSYLRESQ